MQFFGGDITVFLDCNVNSYNQRVISEAVNHSCELYEIEVTISTLWEKKHYATHSTMLLSKVFLWRVCLLMFIAASATKHRVYSLNSNREKQRSEYYAECRYPSTLYTCLQNWWHFRNQITFWSLSWSYLNIPSIVMLDATTAHTNDRNWCATNQMVCSKVAQYLSCVNETFTVFSFRLTVSFLKKYSYHCILPICSFPCFYQMWHSALQHYDCFSSVLSLLSRSHASAKPLRHFFSPAYSSKGLGFY